MINETNLKKFQDILGVINEGVSKKEFEQLARTLIELMKENHKRTNEAIARLEETYQGLLKVVSEKHDISLKEISGKVDHAFVGEKIKRLEEEHGERMSQVDMKMMEMHEKMSKVKNGKTPQKGIDYFDGKPGKDFPIELGRQFDRELEELKKEINKKLEEIKKENSGKRLLGGVLNVGVRVETPTGTVDGANLTFTAYKTPKWIVVDGVQYFENNGYTLSGKQITTSVAPVGFIRSIY